jgi:hemerythrin
MQGLGAFAAGAVRDRLGENVMKWIDWGTLHRTGNPAMDEDHQMLVDLINNLAEGMQSEEPKAFCSGVLEQYVARMKQHFSTEEQLMDAYRYPGAEEHKAIHDVLIKDVLSFKASYDAGETKEFATLLVILDGWLNRDMVTADKALADFVAAAR